MHGLPYTVSVMQLRWCHLSYVIMKVYKLDCAVRELHCGTDACLRR